MYVEDIARLDALTTPHGLHLAVPTKRPRGNCLAARAMTRYQNDSITILPPMLRVTTHVCAVDPATSIRRVVDRNDGTVEHAEGVDLKLVEHFSGRGAQL